MDQSVPKDVVRDGKLFTYNDRTKKHHHGLELHPNLRALVEKANREREVTTTPSAPPAPSAPPKPPAELAFLGVQGPPNAAVALILKNMPRVLAYMFNIYHDIGPFRATGNVAFAQIVADQLLCMASKDRVDLNACDWDLASLDNPDNSFLGRFITYYLENVKTVMFLYLIDSLLSMAPRRNRTRQNSRSRKKKKNRKAIK